MTMKNEKNTTPFDKEISDLNKVASRIKRLRKINHPDLDSLCLTFNSDFDAFKITYSYVFAADPKRKGKKETRLSDPIDEITRLYNNHKSRQAKGSKRVIEKNKANLVQSVKFEGCSNAFIKDRTEDAYGITPFDARRYANIFKSHSKECPPTVRYIQRMTGLTLKQIYILQERTRQTAKKKVEKKAADWDELKRLYYARY